jgi:hypothetical protein
MTVDQYRSRYSRGSRFEIGRLPSPRTFQQIAVQ